MCEGFFSHGRCSFTQSRGIITGRRGVYHGTGVRSGGGKTPPNTATLVPYRMANPRPCDPCAAAPRELQAACRAPKGASYAGCENGTRQCDWVVGLSNTLAFYWDPRKSRGWGNYWPYMRTYHYTAALLGRRLLLAHDDGVIPSDVLLLGGRRSWRLSADEYANSGYHVVRHSRRSCLWTLDTKPASPSRFALTCTLRFVSRPRCTTTTYVSGWACTQQAVASCSTLSSYR